MVTCLHVTGRAAQAMPYLIRGILDGFLETMNAEAHGPTISDPIPDMIRVWELYNEWCHLVTRTEVSTSGLQEIDEAGRSLMKMVHDVFPYKTGPRGKENAWCLMKAHDTVYHFRLSIIQFGRIQVVTICHITLVLI